MTAPRITGASVTFDSPTRVVVEATWDVICAQELDTSENEQYDAIPDVIRIEWRATEVEFTTVRTIERPWRENLVIPRAAIERLIY
jgi:endonuclease/exonuclease/phosphatase family metal-dependent hydrolase